MIGGENINKQYPETLIGAFMGHYKVKDIAAAAGVSVATVNRYKRDPAFVAALNERRAAIVGAAVDKMAGSILRDADVLQSIIDDDGINPAIRLQAIGTKWSHLREWRALLDYDDRLRALETAILIDSERFRPGRG